MSSTVTPTTQFDTMASQIDCKKLKVKCTYGDCMMHFPTEKEMKRHKRDAPEHYYCKKCDVDCESWEALTKHKVDAMWPWLDGCMKGNKDEQPQHIVCEFCGADFKSFGGRKRHRDHDHKADQHIVCPGCQSIFTRAGNYVEHLENGRCKTISRKDFRDNVQLKHLRKELLRDGQQDDEDELPQIAKAGSSVTGESDVRTLEDDGGVPLLDQEDEGQKDGYMPLEAEVNLIDPNGPPKYKLNIPQTRSNMETWPRLPGQAPSQLADTLRSMSISSTACSIPTSEISTSDYASQVTSRRGGTKIYTESNYSIDSPMWPPSEFDYDDTASEATTTIAREQSSAWNTGSSSKLLFKDAKPTPRPGDWDEWEEHEEQERAQMDRNNMLHTKWWDKSSPEYAVHMFYNHLIGKYVCPIKDCDSTPYNDVSDLDGHLQTAHLRRDFRCPLCLKIYKSAHALVSHAESGGSCKVKDSKKFGDLLAEISGGYLDVEFLKTQKVYQTGSADGKKGAAGVMSERFEGTEPKN